MLEKSEFLVVIIPTIDSGLEVTVEEFSDSFASQDRALAEMEKPWVADVVTLYRHPGKGLLANRWWAGLWNGYGIRHERDTGGVK